MAGNHITVQHRKNYEENGLLQSTFNIIIS